MKTAPCGCNWSDIREKNGWHLCPEGKRLLGAYNASGFVADALLFNHHFERARLDVFGIHVPGVIDDGP